MQTLHLAKQNVNQQKRMDGLQEQSRSWIDFPKQAQGFPFCPGDAFNIEYIDGAKVKISGGEIQIADQPAVTCAALEVQITVDYSFVGYEYEYSSGSFAIKNFGSSMVYEAGFLRKWLYQFRFIENKAYYEKNGILNPSLPSNYGDSQA